ncbi:CDP-glycerol glycerophosphotransferase family protein [Sporolactobacillus spathodeae]
MIKEVLIACYLRVFQMVFSICRLLPLKNKIVFVASFTDNPLYVFHALRKQHVAAEIIFLCRGKVIEDFRKTGCSTFPIETFRLRHLLHAAYHLATGKVIIVDNYFAFLSVSHFRRNVTCIQLWHAVGAFKTFGLCDHSIAHRTKRARERFKQVYSHFDKIIVGSDAMEQIFHQSFGLGTDHFIHTGIPRTDLFFDQKKIEKIRQEFHRQYGNKIIILYAPTFRDNQTNLNALPFNPNVLEEKLGNNFVFLLKFHPLVSQKACLPSHSGFIIDCSDQPINTLLLGVDMLITDYSSIPFEFALLDRPMIFFPYDMENYRETRGLTEDYLETVPGPIAENEEQLVACIHQAARRGREAARFSQIWNKYSTGQSSRQVAQYIVSLLE